MARYHITTIINNNNKQYKLNTNKKIRNFSWNKLNLKKLLPHPS